MKGRVNREQWLASEKKKQQQEGKRERVHEMGVASPYLCTKPINEWGDDTARIPGRIGHNTQCFGHLLVLPVAHPRDELVQAKTLLKRGVGWEGWKGE